MGIVWLAIVVTWGVRSVVGALLAGMIFAIAPQRLSIILVLVFFLVVSGVITRLALQHAYRNVFGAVAMVVLAVVAVVGSAWIWNDVSSDDSVKVILAALGLAAALLVGLRVARAPITNRPLRIGLLVVVAALGVWLAFTLAGTDLGEDGTREVPTMLFGLGAIGARERAARRRLRHRQPTTPAAVQGGRGERRGSSSSPPTAPLAGAPA